MSVFDINGRVDPQLLAGVAKLIEGYSAAGAASEAGGRRSAAGQEAAAKAAEAAMKAYRAEAQALDELRQKEAQESAQARQVAANQAQVNVAGTRTAVNAVREQSGAVVNSLRNIEQAQNAGLQALTEKAGQLAQSLGGITGQMADVAVKTVAGFGPMGVAITASVAALGFLLTAEQERTAALARTRAVSESVAGATSLLGASYASVAAAANAATTAEEARVAVAQQVQAIAAQQVTAIGAGFSRDEAVGLVSAYEHVSDASRIAGTTVNRFTQAQVEHAISSGNMAEQMAVLGIAIERSSNAAVEHSNVLIRAAAATREAARVAVEHTEAETRSRDINASSLGALQQLADSSRRLATARTELTAATAAANVVDQHQLDIQQDIERARIAALRAADAARDRANEQAELDKHKASIAPAGGSSGPTAAQRAQARLASQTGARGLVSQLDADAVERRIADLDRLTGAEDDVVGARERAAEREHAIAMRDVGIAAAQSEMAEGLAQKERERLNTQAEAHERYSGRLAELYATQASAAGIAAESTRGAFDAVGGALSKNVQLLVEGRASVGEALQGMLADTLQTIGKQEVIEGGVEFAKGLGALAGVVTAPLAPGHFAAAAAHFAVGAAAGVAGSALAPSAPAAGAGAGGGRGGAGGLLSDRSAPAGEAAGPTVVNNYYAPTFGNGREGSDAEAGMQMNRYTDAERRRTRRAA